MSVNPAGCTLTTMRSRKSWIAKRLASAGLLACTVVLWDETNAGREPNPAGAGGRIGQREEWIKQRGVGGNRDILAA